MVEVVEHRPEWATRFAELRDAYAGALERAGASYLSIEHVGSTAVPGLAAKPVIDVDVVVTADAVGPATAALAAIGLEPRGDLGVADRYAFAAPERFRPTNTYVVVQGSLALRNHLAVRDVLRSDAGLREEYARVKRAAASAAVDIDAYILLKSEVLGTILERAGTSVADREAIAATNRRITARGAAG